MKVNMTVDMLTMLANMANMLDMADYWPEADDNGNDDAETRKGKATAERLAQWATQELAKRGYVLK